MLRFIYNGDLDEFEYVEVFYIEVSQFCFAATMIWQVGVVGMAEGDSKKKKKKSKKKGTNNTQGKHTSDSKLSFLRNVFF